MHPPFNPNLHLNLDSGMSNFSTANSNGANRKSNVITVNNLLNHNAYSPISPNSSANDHHVLGSQPVHFSPTNTHFNKSFSIVMQNNNSGSTVPSISNLSHSGTMREQRPQYVLSLNQPSRKLHHHASTSQLQSPRTTNSPQDANFGPIKCEWNNGVHSNRSVNSHSGVNSMTTSSSGGLRNGNIKCMSPSDVLMRDDDTSANTNDYDDSEVHSKNAEKRYLSTIKNYGTSRVAPVFNPNPSVKYPRYVKLESNRPTSSSTISSQKQPISPSSDTSSVKLPSIDSMSFTTSISNGGVSSTNTTMNFPQDKTTIKDRHQSILSSSNSSCFSTPQSANKRSSYLTTSSLQTSIDTHSVHQKEGLITSIPEYASSIPNNIVEVSQKQPLRFDRPLPMPPVYQNPSKNNSHHLSDIMSENSGASIRSANNRSISTSNSLYNQQIAHLKLVPTSQYFNDGSNASFISQQTSFQSPLQQSSLPSSHLAGGSGTTASLPEGSLHNSSFQQPLPPIPHSEQQRQTLLLQQQHDNPIVNTSTTSFASKTSKESKNSKTSGKLFASNASSSSNDDKDNIQNANFNFVNANSNNNCNNNTNSISSSIANYTSTLKFNSAPEEERKYQCKTCGRKFKTSGHVSRHSRIHTGERKHVCPFPGCGARFARHDNCMQHYKTHSNLNGKTAERMRNLKLKEQISSKKMKIKALIW